MGFEAMTWHLFHLGYLDFSEEVAEELAKEDDGIDASGFESPPADSLARRIDEALEELRGRVISLHGLLGQLRSAHGLAPADAQRISDYYCKRHTPTRSPLWW